MLRRCTPRNDAERNNIAFKGLDVVRQYAVLLERRVQRGTRARKALVVTLQTNLLGRSMIEMLGVLAIIAVLTVGGIAGYSKAMEKFKVNKTVKEYSYVIQGLLEYKDNILKNATEKQTFLTNFLYSAHIIPDSWKIIENSRDYGIHDSYGNDVYFYSFKNSDDKIIISAAIYLGGESKDENNKRISNFSPKLCFELLNNLVKPLHSVLYSGGITEWNSKISFPFGGDNYCGKETTCLNDLSLQKIQQICNSCTEGYCAVVLRFI